MTKEIVKKETAALAVQTENKSWGSENIDASDVVIPKLLLMQGLSGFVSEGKAKLGDIVRSTTGEVVGNAQKGVDIIPLMSFKTWKIMKKVGNKFEYQSIEPVTAANVNADLEWIADNTTWRRDRCLNFYVLLPADIKRESEALAKLEKTGELPDPSDALLPCVITFQRTSYGAGKTLATHFVKAQSFNMPPACSKFSISSKMEKNDLGTFYIFDAANAGMTDETDLITCKKWYDIVSGNSVKIDDSDLVEEKVAKPAAAKRAPARPAQQEEIDIDSVF